MLDSGPYGGRILMSNIGSYEGRLQGFSWEIAKRMLGTTDGEPLNIGWYCSDRICQQGKAQKTALLWEGSSGEQRAFTYDALRLRTNGFAQLVRTLGIEPGERVCIFMD